MGFTAAVVTRAGATAAARRWPGDATAANGTAASLRLHGNGSVNHD
ncbi:hypothetical protein I547_6713 [Mycobacterium kansasii 824]|uniref:Uncharacterized protein n=1 Tax=Mycobacterium kansasii TaxID=1768 RepID=A0A1V3X6P4_MYCKA|nr:hypothetical protein I547_6713 [Mycobacterium kansasii 824]OOK70198.1 hypothetical protein BZL30_6538 [Mycobacterium kansasii]OOK74845.1 hypothetical protein BZL29_4521 [Mycobacterium kansasii]